MGKNKTRVARKKKTWKEMSPSSKAGTIIVAIVQLSLLVAAQRDISKRPAALDQRTQGRLACGILHQLRRTHGLLHLRAEAVRSAHVSLPANGQEPSGESRTAPDRAAKRL